MFQGCVAACGKVREALLRPGLDIVILSAQVGRTLEEALEFLFHVPRKYEPDLLDYTDISGGGSLIGMQ